jgi:glycosyltransferase involved in cell wall biosynthesis
MSAAFVSVVIPCYNEVRTIATVVSSALAQHEVHEVIIIDDGSQDGTRGVLDNLSAVHEKVYVGRHDRNCGKGAAIRSALSMVTGSVVIIQDADLEYDPKNYGILLRPIIEGRAEVVFGSRFLDAGRPSTMSLRHYAGNRLVTMLSNLCTNLRLTDIEVGLKAFKSDVLRAIELREDRFGFEPEVTAKLTKLRGARICEVPISYTGRSHSAGKKIGWRDGFVALWCIIKYNFLSSQSRV